MKDRLRFAAIFLALLFSCFSVDTSYAQGVGSAIEVRQALGELQGWLATSAYGAGWNAYLQNDALTAQLDEASNPAAEVDLTALRAVLARYSSNTPDLQSRRFVAVRETLSAWVNELSQPGMNEIPAAVRVAASTFTAPDANSLAAAKAQLMSAADPLRRYLASGDRGAAWRTFLKWDALQAALQTPSPDVNALQDSLAQFESGYAGLELPMFANTARALRHYTQLNLVSQDPNAQADYARRMNELADAVAAYAQSQDAAALRSVAENVDWLEHRGLASSLTAQIRARLWRPNLIIQITPELATAGFTDHINEVTDVYDVILGTNIQGKARTVGQINAHLLPGPSAAVFENFFTGTIYSQTLGFNRGITISSSGTTKFTATKQFSFNEYGFTDYSADVQANTYSNTEWIDVGNKHRMIRGLVERVAERKVHESRPEADYIAARHAEDRIQEQMNLKAAEKIAQANREYYEKFRKPMLDRGLFPETFDVRSSPAGLMFVLREYAQGGTAAPTSPPNLGGKDDIMISAHESSLNNLATAMLAGKTINRDQFLKDLEELLGELPERMRPPADEQSWTMSFADVDPVTVSVNGGLVTLVIRGTSFQTEGQEANNEALNITVVYRFVDKEGEFQPGEVVARREGEILVLPPDYQEGQVLPARLTGLRNRLKRRFENSFTEEIVAESRPLPDRWKQAGDMWLRHLRAANGWLVFGWEAESRPQEDVPVGLTGN